MENTKLSLVSMLAVWMGFVIVVGTMFAGGGMAKELPWEQLVIVIIGGNVILGLFAALGGWVGAHSGKSFSELLNDTFPGLSGRIVNLYVPIILTFWYAVESRLMGNTLATYFSLSDNYAIIFSIIACVVFSTSAYLGIKVISKISLILVPTIIVLGSWAILSMPNQEYIPTSTFASFGTLNNLLGIVVSTWIMGAILCLQDITRFAKSKTHAALIGFSGVLIGNSFNLIVGAKSALIIGDANPSVILSAIGFSVFGLILIIANLWSTNDNNMYSASLGLSESLKVSRTQSTVILVVLTSIIVIFNPAGLGTIMNGIILMGSTAAALGGVVLSHYFVSGKANTENNTKCAWVALVAGVVVSPNIAGLLGILTTFIVSFVGYNLLTKFTK